jgi:hypothetical protein
MHESSVCCHVCMDLLDASVYFALKLQPDPAICHRIALLAVLFQLILCVISMHPMHESACSHDCMDLLDVVGILCLEA